MSLATDFTVTKKYEGTDPRLGRNLHLDPRSRAFFIPEADSFADIKDVVHKCNIPILDQGQVGSCTGETGTAVMASDDLWDAVKSALSQVDEKVDQDWAYQLYSDTTKDDPFPGYWDPADPKSQDTGSDGLSTAKEIKKRGLISGYTHGNSLLSTLTGLQVRSMMTGTKWLGDMFKPTSDGQIKVTGNMEGGHEYTLFAVDTVNHRVWMRNSWTPGWGVRYPGYADGGCAWMSWDDYEKLLLDTSDPGDSTLLIPLTFEPPQPKPPEPKPPVPPTPVDVDAVFAEQLKTWLNRRPFFYKNVQGQAREWLKGKGL